MDQAQAFLNQLASLVGIQGAFVFDPQGAIRLYSTPMRISQERGVSLARTLSRTLTGLATVQQSNKVDIDLAYGEGRLVVKGLPQCGLCILCDRQVNYALLTITLEQGISALLGNGSSQGVVESSTQTLLGLKQIAEEMLGVHAPKVNAILESAGPNEEELLKAIAQAEKVTRMFINKDQAGTMAERMRDLVVKSI
jgi:hypothetical protein